jgi:hypothetical protein
VPDVLLLAILSLCFLTGAGVSVTALARRAWGLLLIGVGLCAAPLGFASIVVGMPQL